MRDARRDFWKVGFPFAVLLGAIIVGVYLNHLDIAMNRDIAAKIYEEQVRIKDELKSKANVTDLAAVKFKITHVEAATKELSP